VLPTCSPLVQSLCLPYTWKDAGHVLVMRLIPEWHLDYQVVILGAYSTILVESLFLILGRPFDNTSPLCISILTNGSAVLLAGFGGACATSLAALRICVTTVFLLFCISYDMASGEKADLMTASQVPRVSRSENRETVKFRTKHVGMLKASRMHQFSNWVITST